MESKEKILEALAACSEFCCGECPYQHLDDMNYKLKCIHTLIKDTYEFFKDESMIKNEVLRGEKYDY